MGFVNLPHVVFNAWGMFILFNAVNTTQNLMSEELADGGFGPLGFYSLGVDYAVFGVVSLWAGQLITLWGERVCMVIGCMGYTFYTAMQILPVAQKEFGFLEG